VVKAFGFESVKIIFHFSFKICFPHKIMQYALSLKIQMLLKEKQIKTIPSQLSISAFYER
jgi:hypothetical protein